MTTRPSLLEDQFVDMAFITNLTGLTDKWYYKLIKDGLSQTGETGTQFPLVKKRSGSLASGTY